MDGAALASVTGLAAVASGALVRLDRTRCPSQVQSPFALMGNGLSILISPFFRGVGFKP